MIQLVLLDHLGDVSLPIDAQHTVTLAFLHVPLVNHEEDDLDDVIFELGVAEVDVSELESLLVNRVVQNLIVLRSLHVVSGALVVFLFGRPALIVVGVAESFRLQSLAQVSLFTYHALPGPCRDALEVGAELFVDVDLLSFFHEAKFLHAHIKQAKHVE